MIALDQLGNSILGGYPDETISARLWRNRERHHFVNTARQTVDALFYIGFGQVDHCQHAHEWEVSRGDSPAYAKFSAH